jgi:hypothetical protein
VKDLNDDPAGAIARNTFQVASAILDPLSRFLNVARRDCGGDAEKVVLMVGVILRSSLHPDYHKLSAQFVESGDFHHFPTLGVNIASLAQSTGLPRETARRKVRELAQMGWLEIRGRKIYYTRTGYLAVARPREALIRFAIRMGDLRETEG